MRRIRKGTGKYKGELTLKCFSCGQIIHYVSRCPNRVVNDKNKENKGKKVKKIYYVREDDDISNDELIMEILMMMNACSWL